MVQQVRIEQATDILGLVDVQPTFMPGGELPVPSGDEVVPVINRLALAHFRHCFATQDWHPADHASFAGNHPGRKPYDVVRMPYGEQVLWPDHALQGSAGAALHPDLDQSRIEMVVRKGFHTEIDSYSAFFENDRRTPTGLAGYLRERGVRRVFLAGLATDFCVAYSAEDAVGLGFTVFVIEDGCRGIGIPTPDGGDTVSAARRRLAELGVRLIESGDIA